MNNFRLLAASDFYIVMCLYKNKGEMSSFNMFRRLKISFSDFMSCLRGLEKRKIIKIDEEMIFLEKLGYKIIYGNQKVSQKKGVERVPVNMRAEYVLPIGAPYVPKISAIKSLLKDI